MMEFPVGHDVNSSIVKLNISFPAGHVLGKQGLSACWTVVSSSRGSSRPAGLDRPVLQLPIQSGHPDHENSSRLLLKHRESAAFE
jgi:hypothetical protein